MMPSAERVLFLGLDGGTWTAIEPWIERGLTPNLAAFWRRAARGVLRSSTPMVTPVAWTSFATGCEPALHGIHEFYFVDPNDRTIHPNDSTRIRQPVLWQHLAAEGRSVVSVNLPMTYPSPPGVRGLVIGGADAPGLEWAFAQCPEFGREIRAFVPAFSHRIVWKTRPKSTDEVCALAVETSAIFEAQVETAIRADRRVDWSALMVHFHNLDGLQHRLWPELELDTTFPLRREWVEPTIRMIRALDSAVGRLLELAAHRGAAVIAVSDHGFGPCRELVNVNGLLCRAGLQRKLSYGTRFRYRLSRLADRLRRWSARREGAGRRSHRSIEGQVGCDWKRTVAFAPFGQLSGCIFVTEEVQGESRERVLAEVIGTLREARHPETDELLFEDAFSIADRYGLDPRREGLPDVMAASSDGYQAQAKWSPFCDRLLKPDPDLPGTHYMDGILAIDAAGIAPRSDLRAELVDVAPTTMALMGLPVPARMRGRVVREACSNDCAVDTGRRRLGRFDAAEAAPSPAVLRYAPGA